MITSGHQANHFPVFSFLPPAHTSFSKTIPWDPLPSGFYSSPQTAVGEHGRAAACSPNGKLDSTAAVQGLCVSPSLSVWPSRFSQGSRLPVSSPDPCWVHQDILAGILWHLCSCLSFLVFFPPPRARSTLLLTQQVQPLVLFCFFTPPSLESPAGFVTCLLCARLVCVPLSLMAYRDARLSTHMNAICKFFASFSDAATQGPLLPPVHCQHPHLSSFISLPLCSLALLI